MARIATGNYDAVIVSHRSFEFLPVSDDYFNRFVQKQVAELDAEIGLARESKDDNRRIVKELEKAKKRLTVRLKKRADRESKDRTLTFEELGIDQLSSRDDNWSYAQEKFMSSRIRTRASTRSSRLICCP